MSPDTLVPDPENVLAYNRYMYALGNPLKYSDPSGHCEETPDGDDAECWHLLQQLLHGQRTKGIYDYEETKAWNSGQIDTLINFWDVNDFDAMNPDVFIVGGNAGIAFNTPIGFDFSFTIGVEYLGNYDSGEQDVFVTAGGSLEMNARSLMGYVKDPGRLFSGSKALKLGAKASVYLGDGFNIEENSQYSGQAATTETTAGYGPYTFSDTDFYTPGNPAGPKGSLVGWSPSAGLNVGRSASAMNAVRARDIWNSAIDLVNGR